MSVHPDPVQFTETQSQLTRDLIEARALLHKKGWTQAAFARDTNGCECAILPDGVTFCAVGAIYCVTHSGGGFRPARAVDALCKVLAQSGYKDTITIWNDDPARTKEDVLALFEAAIFDSMKGAN